MDDSESGQQLEALIRKAFEDEKITASEYESIIMMADADSVISPREKSLLSQLKDMMDDGSIKRVP